MKNNLLFLAFLLSAVVGRAQTSFVSVDSILHQQLLLPNRIVIGEMHQVQGTYKAYENIIRSLDPGKHYKLVIERSVSFAYLINEFLSGSDTTVFGNLPFHNDEERAFYVALHYINQALEPTQKILTIGIDLEYQLEYAHTLAALMYYLPKTTSPPFHSKIKEILNDSVNTHVTKVKKLLSLIDTATLNANSYDHIVKSIYSNTQNTIMISHSSGITWGRKREHFLLKNFQNRVSATTNFIFIVGVAHLPDNTLYPSFTKELENDAASPEYYYPIYFNHIPTPYIKKGYYCEHRKNPLKSEPRLFTYFDSHKGGWIMKKSEVNYLIISN